MTAVTRLTKPRRTWTRPLPKERLDVLCEHAPVSGSQAERVYWFVQLVAWLRPRPGTSVAPKLRYLENMLARHPAWRTNVSLVLGGLLASCNVRELFAHGGIARDFHLLGAVVEWGGSRLLPAACATNDADQVLALAFRPGDEPWLGELGQHSWVGALIDRELYPSLTRSLSEACIDLAHQIVAQAHAPSVRSLSSIARSPFAGLYEAVLAQHAAPREDGPHRALLGRLRECLLLIHSQRARLVERGADLNTTFQLSRLSQQLERLALLSKLAREPSHERIGQALVEFASGAVERVKGKHLLRRSVDLLLQNVVDTAASVGRDYLGRQSALGTAFRAGAGGGALMAVATMTKFLLGGLHLSPLYEGLVFSLNYAAVFCAAFMLHLTIATKLPAHTAAALERCVQEGQSHRARLANFGIAFRAMLRLQMAGLLGNLVVAAPLGAAIALLFSRGFGYPLVSADKAEHVLASQSLLGPSLLYAALTGVFLWLSSLFGAVVDNWARVTRLRDRLATSLRAMARPGRHAVDLRAHALSTAAGGLSANLALGFMLGGIPALFAIAQLPVEIRHVTVSASSVAMALTLSVGSARDIALAVAGVLAIGLVNVLVSFALALWLALRANEGLRTRSTAAALVRVGIRRWLRGGRPRPSPPRASASTSATEAAQPTPAASPVP